MESTDIALLMLSDIGLSDFLLPRSRDEPLLLIPPSFISFLMGTGLFSARGILDFLNCGFSVSGVLTGLSSRRLIVSVTFSYSSGAGGVATASACNTNRAVLAAGVLLPRYLQC